MARLGNSLLPNCLGSSTATLARRDKELGACRRLCVPGLPERQGPRLHGPKIGGGTGGRTTMATAAFVRRFGLASAVRADRRKRKAKCSGRINLSNPCRKDTYAPFPGGCIDISSDHYH